MQQSIKIGCCGWGYLNPSNLNIKTEIKNRTLLQLYATIFDTVEVNYTFYRIPKLETVKRWRQEVDLLNKDFEFTIKAFQIITHKLRFSEAAISYFDTLAEICKNLNSKVILFQSPASFKPKKENILLLEKFFDKTSSEKYLLVWEPRGEWHIDMMKSLFDKYNVIHCVDPFRNTPYISKRQKIIYLRLHGLGEIMYSYKFRKVDLENLIIKLKEIPKNIRTIYVYFNNTNCYEDALTFKQML